MNHHDIGQESRSPIEELLFQRATSGLVAAEKQELENLLAALPEAERQRLEAEADEWERTATTIDLAHEESDLEVGLPAHLRRRLSVEADRAFGVAEREPVVRTVQGTGRGRASVRGGAFRQLGWWAAAACLALAVIAGWPRWVGPENPGTGPSDGAPVADTNVLPKPPTAAEARARLLDGAADGLLLAWTATEDPTATGASGDVLWSPEAQRGFLRFRGLAANDPAEYQYQLWIFDRQRDERYPVDGGVFDVVGDEIVVPIEAKLPVGEAYLFAITIEPPGGVVVSDRERVALLAQLDA